MLNDIGRLLPALDNVPVFILVAVLLLAAMGTSIVSILARSTNAATLFTSLKPWIAVPFWLLFGGWLVLGASMLTFVGMMGSLTLVLLAPSIGLCLLLLLSVLMLAWIRSKPWADWVLLVSIAGSMLLIVTMQRLWICEPLAWAGLEAAQMCTAELYASGEQGAIRNKKTASDWYGQAARQGSEQAVLAILKVTPNKLTHQRLLESAAQAGNGAAMYQLFLLLGPSDGTRWLELAIGIRHPDALYQQSRFMLAGEHGFALDPAGASALLVEAAELGSSPASAALALAYERGDQSTGYSRSASLRWEGNVNREWSGWSLFKKELAFHRDLRDRVTNGDPGSMLILAENYERRARGEGNYQADAELWFIRAADAGSVEAQFDMAFQYFRKPGASAAELAMARRWLIDAADRRHRYALFNVSHYLTNGQYGFEIDLDQAYAYGVVLIDVLEESQASQRDRRHAEERLARIEQQRSQAQAWSNGLDDLQTRSGAGEAEAKYQLYDKHMQDQRRGDRDLARKLLLEAAELGHLEARYRIASRTFQQPRTEEEEDRAYLWMADAAERGHRGALVFMGRLYHRGSRKAGIEIDPDRAREAFELALEGLEGDVVHQQKNGRMTVSTTRQTVEDALASVSAVPADQTPAGDTTLVNP